MKKIVLAALLAASLHAVAGADMDGDWVGALRWQNPSHPEMVSNWFYDASTATRTDDTVAFWQKITSSDSDVPSYTHLIVDCRTQRTAIDAMTLNGDLHHLIQVTPEFKATDPTGGNLRMLVAVCKNVH